jgi:hypothetical protein
VSVGPTDREPQAPLTLALAPLIFRYLPTQDKNHTLINNIFTIVITLTLSFIDTYQHK